MTFFEWARRLASNIIFIIRSGHSHGRFQILRTYIRIELKRFFLVNLCRRRITREKFFGFELHFFEYETFAILFEELYLPDAYYFSTASKEPIIVDCGSNIGLAIMYFKKLYPSCRITAFEADPTTFKMLERNVSENRLEHVTLVNGALYDSKGTIPFYISCAQPGLLVQSTRHESLPQSEAVLVNTELLSDYIDEPVDFLKMDIEGAEEKVMKNLLDQSKLAMVKELVLEYHHHITPKEDRLGSFLRILEQGNFGYQIKAPLAFPFRPGEFQAFLIYAYHNGTSRPA